MSEAVACSHVSGLFSRSLTAGPDGNRGARPDHSHEVAMPRDTLKVSLDPSIDRRCHHFFTLASFAGLPAVA